MRKILSQLKPVLALAVAFFAVAILASSIDAYPRSPGGTAQTVTEDEGNTLTPFNSAIGTTTAVAIYTKTGNKVDRKLVVCNDQAATYRLLLSTSNAITGLASTQDIRTHRHVSPDTCVEMNAPSQTIYGVFKASDTSGSFTGGRAYGYKRSDSRD